ncbi:MAG: hypothetical protein L0Y54_15800 [Sporichthyaceae bacterium]|nr:hypothetical protein [Sporichthyaceae bacterium]
MQLRFLGKETVSGGSPTLYDIDEDQYIVQGYKVTDPDVLAQLDIPDHETVIAIPKKLMSHLPKDEPHGALDG